MEILFKSPTYPEGRPLHDALAENCLEALSTLSCAICDTIFTMNLFPSESFLSSLQSIQFLVSRFRLELENINPGFTFTLKELYIIQDASLSLYGEADIEGAFYKYGGYDGIIALILYFRNSENISKAWNTIIEGHRRWFVKYIARMLSRQKVELVSQYHNIKRSLNPHTLLFYLGNHAGRKRKKRTLETEGSPSAIQLPSWSIPKSTLVIAQSQSKNQPSRANNSYRQNQQSFRSYQTPKPIPHVSSPPQQQHQNSYNSSTNLEIANISHKYVPSTTFSASPFGPSKQDPNIVYHFHKSVVPVTRDTKQHQWSPTSATKISGDQKSTSLCKSLLSGFSRVSHSPSTPQALFVSEQLFQNIKLYFEKTCQNLNMDEHGTLLDPNGAKLNDNLCSDFDSYCFTATLLQKKGMHVDFRRALSKASALIEQILRAEHPRTLACFLEVFIHLIQNELPDVTYSLRGFIKEMSAKVTGKLHPWGRICCLLGELDSGSFDEAMAQIWRCMTDIFDSELGTSNRLAVSVRLDYIKRVYGVTDCLEEERLLRDLFAKLGHIPESSTPRTMLNLAHNLNRQRRYDEAEKMAWEINSLLREHDIYGERIVERIESLKIISLSQFNQGSCEAERTIRQAIQMIVDEWGMQHSWVPEFMTVLEGWLRVWGREDDANKLWEEIEDLIEKDGIEDD